MARFGDAYVWGVSTLQPSQMEQLLADVCTAGRALLDLGHAAFSRSGEYVTLLESMGAYDKEAHSLVDPDDLAEVEADLMAAPAAEGRADGGAGLRSQPPTANCSTGNVTKYMLT